MIESRGSGVFVANFFLNVLFLLCLPLLHFVFFFGLRTDQSDAMVVCSDTPLLERGREKKKENYLGKTDKAHASTKAQYQKYLVRLDLHTSQ